MEMQEGITTPHWLFDLLNERVEVLTGQRFQLDAAAAGWNAKCADYFDEQTDALSRDWSDWDVIFCNPPYSASLIERFVERALHAAEHGSTVVLLLPSWPGYGWFQELKRRGQMQDVIGPVAFEDHDGSEVVPNSGRKTSGIVAVILAPKVTPGTDGPPLRNPSRCSPEPHPQSVSVKAPRRPVVSRLSELDPEPTEWLWHLRIPKGELTVVDGDPSVNKSSVLLDLVARVSTGREMPDGTPGTFGGVLLLSSEDSIEKTVILRLVAAGADLSRVAVPSRSLLLPRDLRLLEEAVASVQAKLVVIDPMMAFLACDANGDQKVRQALTPLKGFAERSGVAVVLVRHLTKRGGRQALYRGGGSIGIIAATRSALLVAKEPG